MVREGDIVKVHDDATGLHRWVVIGNYRYRFGRKVQLVFLSTKKDSGYVRFRNVFLAPSRVIEKDITAIMDIEGRCKKDEFRRILNLVANKITSFNIDSYEE